MVSPGDEVFLWAQRNTESRNASVVGASENLRNATMRSRVMGLLWALYDDVLAESTE